MCVYICIFVYVYIFTDSAQKRINAKKAQDKLATLPSFKPRFLPLLTFVQV